VVDLTAKQVQSFCSAVAGKPAVSHSKPLPNTVTELQSPFTTGADPASAVKEGGGISVIFGSQISLRVHYCKRDEAYFTTLL